MSVLAVFIADVVDAQVEPVSAGWVVGSWVVVPFAVLVVSEPSVVSVSLVEAGLWQARRAKNGKQTRWGCTGRACAKSTDESIGWLFRVAGARELLTRGPFAGDGGGTLASAAWLMWWRRMSMMSRRCGLGSRR